MARLSMNVVATVLVIAALVGCDAKDVSKRQAVSIQFPTINTNDILRWICEDNPYADRIDFCQSTTSTTTKAPVAGSTSTMPALAKTTTTTESPSVLERAYWCRLSNGSFLSRGYSFMHTECQLCQCTQSRSVRCVELQCMPTYCIDNTTPTRKAGQCCGQCAYQANATQCVQNGIAFPHGTIVKATSDRVYCWCQLGTIECRKIGISLFSGMDLWGEGTAVYVIVIIICALLIVGTLLCGGCSLLYYYYYYYYNQQPTEQNFWENAGWQPMGEEEQVVDGEAAKKQAEAEQSQQGEEYPAGYTPEFVPPPYALYNGGYESEQANKDQKYV